MKKILMATNNSGKVKELSDLLQGYEVISLSQLNCKIEVEENKSTFKENAKKKAKQYGDLLHMTCIADDSGLCIPYFDGWPGVKTARFLGKNTTARQRNEAILEKMKNLKGEERSAKVVCCLAYYNNKQWIIVTEEIEGKIAEKRRGENGFGFDEIFELQNGKTLAELSFEQKNKISARKRAILKLKQEMNKIV